MIQMTRAPRFRSTATIFNLYSSARKEPNHHTTSFVTIGGANCKRFARGIGNITWNSRKLIPIGRPLIFLLKDVPQNW